MTGSTDGGRRALAGAALPIAAALAALAGLWRPDTGNLLAGSGALELMVPAVMFLISLRVDGSQLAAAVRRPLPLIASLAIVFGLFPPVALGWHALLGPPGPDGRTAMLILASQPGTLATAAVLTSIGGGNVALALVCTTASQIASAAMTPLLLAAYVGATVHVDVGGLARDLAIHVVLPIVAGQALRLPLRARLDRAGPWLALGAEAIVVAFVLVGFSRARPMLFSDPGLALAAVAAVTGIHATMLAASAAAGSLILRSGGDRLAFTMAASQKTVAAGILVWQSGFPANPVGPLFLVLHHLVQTVGDALLAPRAARVRVGRWRPFRSDR